jgi:hypothetical protein
MANTHKTLVGAIVGGIVGGMIGLIELFLLFLGSVRRRNMVKGKYVTHMRSNSEVGAPGMTAIVTPLRALHYINVHSRLTIR